MQTSASPLPPNSFLGVLARLPADLDLDALALSTGAIRRRRQIGDGTTLLRLALARGPGGLSLNQTAAWAGMIGLPALSDPGLKYRLDQAVPFLKALMERQLAARAGGASLHWPGRLLQVVDGTAISQPGSPGSDWLVHAGLDLGTGQFRHLELTDTHGAESILRGAPQPGEIRIGDRNYATAASLQALRAHSGGQADFIVRVRWKAFALAWPDGSAFGLIQHLAGLPNDTQPREVLVQARVKHAAALPLRLVIQRTSPERTAAVRRHLQRSAPRKQKKVDPRSLAAAGFLILATSLPVEGYQARDIIAAYGLRWQIELAFKRLKSLLHLDRLVTRTPAASRSWLYAHLILALLSDDISQEVLESFPSGLH